MKNQSTYKRAKRDIIEVLRAISKGTELPHIAVIDDPSTYIKLITEADRFHEIVVLSTAEMKMREEAKQLATEALSDALGFSGSTDDLQELIKKGLEQSFDKYYADAVNDIRKQIGMITGNFNDNAVSEQAFGLYDEASKNVYINCQALGNAYDEESLYYATLETIAHEIGHAIQFEACNTGWCGNNAISLNRQLARHVLASLLPPKQILKGWDSFIARKHLSEFFYRHTGANITTIVGVKRNHDDITAALAVRRTDIPPTPYSTVAPEEYWAESFALFLTNNKGAKLLMPDMYDYILNLLGVDIDGGKQQAQEVAITA